MSESGGKKKPTGISMERFDEICREHDLIPTEVDMLRRRFYGPRVAPAHVPDNFRRAGEAIKKEWWNE